MASSGQGNRAWWPQQLNLAMLHQQSALSNPMVPGFDYPDAFQQLDLVDLDKALRPLWPIRQKYGRNISWADLLVLTSRRCRWG